MASSNVSHDHLDMKLLAGLDRGWRPQLNLGGAPQPRLGHLGVDRSLSQMVGIDAGTDEIVWKDLSHRPVLGGLPLPNDRLEALGHLHRVFNPAHVAVLALDAVLGVDAGLPFAIGVFDPQAVARMNHRMATGTEFGLGEEVSFLSCV